MSQGDFRYFIDATGLPIVRRRERFRTTGQHRECIDYIEYATFDDVPLARELVITRFGSDGSPRAPLQVRVPAVAANQGLPPARTAFARIG